ncbi:DUF3887 domain-containing protein [Mycobacterium sp. 1274756.6]|uniref:DUF3887 domain-containing protein n=1 Tax=Mycobacterium sp. 1274756.6 TaxID=1834076 RepID=UPI0009ED504D|nr:DUF3887 domain-containing protein [Mycobacterium sp. 1274756.6]
MTGSLGRRATALAAAALAAAATVAGCSPPEPREKPDPTTTVTTSTSEPEQSAQRRDDQLATEILENIVNHEFDAATARFDDDMKEKLPPAELSSAWTTYQQQLGSYESHGGPESVPRGEFTVVNIPLNMTEAPGQFRVTFHDDGTVAGLYFLVAGVPVP